MTPVCEVRVPTYRRPVLLERALVSVIAQSHPHWRCIILDDCPDGSAEKVVARFADERLVYRRNERGLRAIGNIDQAFRNAPLAGGHYACVLEDDNYLLAGHLETQLEHCARHEVPVTFSAQLCEEVVEAGRPGRLSDSKTVVAILPEGKFTAREVLPAVLSSHAFSNGSAFWQLGCGSDFEIGAVTRRPGIQETLRMLKLKTSVFISHDATSVWRANDPRDSYVSSRPAERGVARLRAEYDRLRERREISDYRVRYLEQLGIADALAFARTRSPREVLGIERALLLSGHYVTLTDRSAGWRSLQMLKGHAFRMLVPPQLALGHFRLAGAAG